MTNQNTSAGSIEGFNQNLIDNIQGGVIICRINQNTGKSNTLYMSEGWTQLTGYTIEALEDAFSGNPLAIIIPEDMEKSRQDYFEQINRGQSYQIQYRLQHREGHIIWVIDRGVFTLIEDGIFQNQSIITDISSLMESEERLRMSEARLRMAIKASNAAVYELDAKTNACLSLENAEVVFCAGAAEVIDWADRIRTQGKNFVLRDALGAWYHSEDIPLLERAHETLFVSGVSECEARVRQQDNSYIWCKLHLAYVGGETEDPTRIIGHLVNVDTQHRRTEQLQLKAQSDALTGLYNKTAVRELIVKKLEEAPPMAKALMILDIDNFKGVNDHLGHLFGDAVLMDVSAKLKKIFHLGSLVGRIGGDEFAVFLSGVSEEDASAYAAEICRAFRHIYSGEKSDYKISCSVGVAMFNKGDSFESLFRKADIALYQAKSRGKDQFTVYTYGPLDDSDSEALYGQTADGDSGRLMIKERIFELLYGSMDFSGSINMILLLLGQLLDASRVYIYENTPDNAFAYNIYEWCAEGIIAGIPEQRELPVGELDYFSLFDENNIFCCNDLSALPPGIHRIYESGGMHALFQVAIQEDGIIRGFMGYDSVEDSASLTSEQTDIMTFAAKIVGTFMIKKHADESMKLYNENKMEALDVLPCGIYVIDEAYRLQYMNDFTKHVFPQACPGMKCYEIFMHKSTPCSICPGAGSKTMPSSIKMINPYTRMHLIVSASKIKWSGREGMRLICCQEITGEI